MLFNSFAFILAFLPLTLALFSLLFHKYGVRPALTLLAAASLFFYGWWNPWYLLLLGGSIIFNFYAGRAVVRAGPQTRRSKQLMLAGVAVNLLVLAFFKYADFLIGTTNAVAQTHFPLLGILLPLAISFVTFQKIAFLADCYQGKAREDDLLYFTVFVTFFPQLIAGPIVHYREMMPQFRALKPPSLQSGFMAAGLTLFAIGLFKKTVLADTAAIPADTVFNAAHAGQVLSAFDAWAGALAYSFQIYFDFSGYSDMAIGLALFFGIRLPINFLSPYTATGFVDFWRRWHITLSRFLRDYLYIPLGGNRGSRVRQIINISVTMLLGGLWHGASWNFVLWGGLHGVFIALDHTLRRFVPERYLPAFITIPVTFMCITVLWVFFRAESMGAVENMLAGMAGFNAADASRLVNGANNILIFCACAATIFILPSSMRFMKLNHEDPEVSSIPVPSIAEWIAKRLKLQAVVAYAPSLFCFLLTVGMLLVATLFMQSNLGNQFIYFDF